MNTKETKLSKQDKRIKQERRLSIKNEFLPKFNSIFQIIRGINEKSKKDPYATFKDLYSLLQISEIHIQALGNIRPNDGMSTAGVDNKTLDGMNLKTILEITKEFSDKTFKFSPVRRVYVPKPGSTKLRPLGIPTIKDRIVQESIKLILESIYEPCFNTIPFQNYGFRPNKSTHDAIEFIKKNGTANNIALEGDIKGAFDNVDHKLLIKFLNKKIKDQKFLSLIYQGCKCGIMEFNKTSESLAGIPQGGIASPVLFNIYMHEFDLYINYKFYDIIQKYNKITHRTPQTKSPNTFYRNPVYHNITSKITYYNNQKKQFLYKSTEKNYLNFSQQEKSKFKDYDKNIKELNLKKIQTPSILKNKRPITFIYTRYADDFIILINCKNNFAKMIVKNIKNWMINNLKLELSLEKTKITNITYNYARFLGFTLYSYNSSKITKNEFGKLIRTGGYNIKCGIDKERVLKRFLNSKKFCNNDYKPIGLRPLSVLPLKDIIDKFNAIIRGLAEYYIPMINDTSSFSQLYYILQYSCYGTIATKYKTSIYKLFIKYGKFPKFNIKINIKFKSGIIPPTPQKLNYDPDSITLEIIPYKTLLETILNRTFIQKTKAALSPQLTAFAKNFEPMKTINWRTYKNLRGYCCICGSRENIEWHHIKSVSSIKSTGFAKVMSSLNRKQMPFCKTHHDELTQGKYSGTKISDLVDIDYWIY